MRKTLKNTNEKDIIALMLRKDIRGIELLYERYNAFLYGLIVEIVKFEDLSEIVLQDTFMKIWLKVDQFSIEKGRFSTWIMNIARNTAIDMMRSKNYKQTLKLISLDSIPVGNLHSTIQIQVENIDLQDIVAKLAPKYKSIIDLVYFRGYTQVEVAKELEIPLGTVKSRTKKAFAVLRNILSE